MNKQQTTDSSHEKIVPYDPKWVTLYDAEANKLKKVFGAELLGIEHIGSTSVLGLPAKPITDLMVLIDNHQNAEKYISKLKAIGYTYNPADVSTERHMFRKGYPTQYHLSIAYKDRGSFWKRQLAFREYLRKHPEELKRYAKLKQELIKKYPTGRDSYIDGKTALINEMLDASGFVRWRSKNG